MTPKTFIPKIIPKLDRLIEKYQSNWSFRQRGQLTGMEHVLMLDVTGHKGLTMEGIGAPGFRVQYRGFSFYVNHEDLMAINKYFQNNSACQEQN